MLHQLRSELELWALFERQPLPVAHWYVRGQKRGQWCTCDKVRFEGHTYPAYRLAYILDQGPVTEGMYLYAVCGKELCCNPEHRIVVDRAEYFRLRALSEKLKTEYSKIPGLVEVRRRPDGSILPPAGGLK